MRVKWLEEEEKRKRSAAPPPKRKKEKEAEDAGRSEDAAERMQRAFGNAALGQMVQSLLAREEYSAALAQLAPPYQELAMRLIAQAAAEGDHERIRRFLALSAGQKAAALQMTALRAGSKRREAKERLEGADPEHWEYGIQAVAGVRLKKDEPDKEGDIADSGAEPQEPISANTNGLLPPYKDIVLWLTYKANKQGKQDLMRRFFAMSVPEKKLALKLMASEKKKALEFKALTEALTVPVQLKEWVDWDTVAGALDKTREIAAKLDEHEVKALVENKDAELPGLEEEDGGDGAFPLMALLGAAAGADLLQPDDEPDAKQARQKGGLHEQAPQEMEPGKLANLTPDLAAWLLLGTKRDKPLPDAIAEFCKSGKDPKAVVDRFLKVPQAESEQALEKARLKLLKKHGFHSVEQCYAHIMETVAKWIHEGAAVRKDPAFLRLLEELGLIKGKGQLPELEEIIRKLMGR